MIGFLGTAVSTAIAFTLVGTTVSTAIAFTLVGTTVSTAIAFTQWSVVQLLRLHWPQAEVHSNHSSGTYMMRSKYSEAAGKEVII